LTPLIFVVAPEAVLAEPTMLIALGSLTNGPAGEPRSLFNERSRAYWKFLAVTFAPSLNR